jgi:hypothetical protein
MNDAVGSGGGSESGGAGSQTDGAGVETCVEAECSVPHQCVEYCGGDSIKETCCPCDEGMIDRRTCS